VFKESETRGTLIHLQVFFASFNPTQVSFSGPAPCYLNSKGICVYLCTHGHAGLKTRCVQAVRVAILRQLKYFWGNRPIDKQKHDLKSMAQYFIFICIYLFIYLFCYLNGTLVICALR